MCNNNHVDEHEFFCFFPLFVCLVLFVVVYARQLDFVFLRHSALELGGAFLFALRNGCNLIGLKCVTQGKQHYMKELLTLCEAVKCHTLG